MINEQRALSEFFELVRLQCSSRAEREAADVVKAKLSALGFEVAEDAAGAKIGGNAGNVIGYLRGSKPAAPVLMLSAHLDCVEPCGGIKPRLANGVITSGGDTILGGDDKAGMVSILEALRTLREEKTDHGDIQVIFTVAEECGLQGVKHIDPGLLKADLGYILDGGALGEITDAQPGQNNINVIIRGRTAHAGVAPEEGINAIIVAGRALAELKQGRIDPETTANVGIIKGGTATNVVPDCVELALEARSRNAEKLEVQTKNMAETFQRVAAANGAQAEVTVRKMYESYVLDHDAPVLRLARQASEAIGLPFTLKPSGGGSDANYFNAFGVPSAVLGVGVNKAHTTDEYIKAADLYRGCELVLALIKTVAAHAAD